MEEKKIKVSVVMPSLNMRQYIEESVESVINQTLKEIEIICVDAGSTDGTLEILREYEKKDDRVRVIISDKKSCGYQMNLGVKAAKGEYIGIVETDDFILPRMYEELYTIAKDNDVDLVKADFYRFTGSGEDLKQIYYRLHMRGDIYHRVINVEEEQDTFQLVMNIWSGIYKRDFLLKNDIWQNETPGASYQDNGFWFLTFVYAKRAYFYRDAYYMNRRDNPGSSIYDSSKVYCICDEYEYIEKILRERGIFDRFKFVFAFYCFQNYKANIERISSEYKAEFVREFSETFRRFRAEGIIDFRLFNEVDWEMLQGIIEDPNAYYEKRIAAKEKFYEEIRAFEKVIIYGTGMIGSRTYHQMTYRMNPLEIFCFAVTKREGKAKTKNEIPIYSVDEITEYKEDAAVIIAVTTLYQNEIRKTLEEYGFKNIFISPEADEEKTDPTKFSKAEREQALCEWYEGVTGKSIDLKHPRTFNEKQQWLKLYDVSDEKRVLADRLGAREWVKKHLGEKYLIPLYAVYDNADSIKRDDIPLDETVLFQYSHGIRMNKRATKYSIYGKLMQPDGLKRVIGSKLKQNAAYERGFEMVYDGISPKVMMMPMAGEFFLPVYKFLCFDGKPTFVAFDSNQRSWTNRHRDIFDMEWNRIDAEIKYTRSETIPEKPVHFDEMKEIAKKISEGFKFCVIHLFDTEEGVLFNEVKFSFGCGVEKVTEWLDRELEEIINL